MKSHSQRAKFYRSIKFQTTAKEARYLASNHNFQLLWEQHQEQIRSTRRLMYSDLWPIIFGTGLTKNEVIGAKDLAIRAWSDAAHGTRSEIHKHSPGYVPATGNLIVIDIDPLELDIRFGLVATAVLSCGINVVLVADYFPEFGTDLVAALASLHVQDLSHGCGSRFWSERWWEFRVWYWEMKWNEI